jgi:hypothetical protein
MRAAVSISLGLSTPSAASGSEHRRPLDRVITGRRYPLTAAIMERSSVQSVHLHQRHDVPDGRAQQTLRSAGAGEWLFR